MLVDPVLYADPLLHMRHWQRFVRTGTLDHVLTPANAMAHLEKRGTAESVKIVEEWARHGDARARQWLPTLKPVLQDVNCIVRDDGKMYVRFRFRGLENGLWVGRLQGFFPLFGNSPAGIIDAFAYCVAAYFNGTSWWREAAETKLVYDNISVGAIDGFIDFSYR